jgi:hypothetical protein
MQYCGMQPGLRSNAGRRLFALLAFLVLTLSIDVLGLVGVADSKATQRFELPPSTTAAWKSLDTGGHQMLEKEHEAITEEIRQRVGEEHLLFTLKFGLVGAILWAFLQTAFRDDAKEFEPTPFAALAAWAAVVAASIVDLRAMTNQRFIITLGGWTRQYELLTLGPKGARLGWEAFLADNLLSHAFYPALRVNAQILTALLFCVTAYVFLVSVEGKVHASTARISAAFGTVSICLMTMTALSIRNAGIAIAIYLGAGLLSIVVITAMARRSRRNDPDAGSV